MTQIKKINIIEEMKVSYLDYSMSVIVGRALPDVRDGFKPVHRRILYAMFREGLLSNRRFSKCAGVVGEVLKKYHPHGDSAVYDALVRLAQNWNMRYPLVEGQGNFGNIDGDPAAAYRYTEARMEALSETMLADIDQDTVDWQPNFDEQTEEPIVLPTPFPNLLVNGSSGIAVGMATNIPPHNLVEVIDGLLMLLDHPEISDEKLFSLIPGPDFPTGGTICGREGIEDAYRTGRGKVLVRAKTHFEEEEGQRTKIVVDEIPYMVNKGKLLEKIGELVKDQKVTGIAELRDESDRQGMRIVIEVKRGELPEVILNQLFQHTYLQNTFGIIMLCLVDQQPMILTLRGMLTQFLAFRTEIITRRTQFQLNKALARAHILEGFVRALDLLDEIIETIRQSATPQEAKGALMARFEFSELQSQAILELRLQKLTGMERQSILEEHAEIQQRIFEYRHILSDRDAMMSVIRTELVELKERFPSPRRTIIGPSVKGSFDIEDLIVNEQVVVTFSQQGYIKRTTTSSYREQRRGGKGRLGMKTYQDDFVRYVFSAHTHDYLLVFTNTGRLYELKVHQLPETDPASRGKALVNLIPFEEGEHAVTFLAVEDYLAEEQLVFCTKFGTVKKTPLKAFANIRANGIRALNIHEGDELIGVERSSGNHELFLATRKGRAIRFDESEVRSMGRSAAGVIGVRLQEDDYVIEMTLVPEGEGEVLTVSANGYGKITSLQEYRQTHRGGMGVMNMKVNEKTGPIAAVKFIHSPSILVMSQFGKLIRMDVSEVRHTGRVTQGVKFIQLDDPQDQVSGMSILLEEENEGGNEP